MVDRIDSVTDLEMHQFINQYEIKLFWMKWILLKNRNLINYRYFQRFNEELDQMKKKASIGGKRVGSQNLNREQSIQITLETEKNEYETIGIGSILVFFSQSFEIK